MSEKPEPGVSFDPDADWLQVVQGRTPILLIAPHGGRAGKAARARLHPRINDLHTADITRELSRRLQAHALINTGMDRNALDCNRIEDIAHKAPWILARVAGQVEKLIDRHGHVLVLVIHGWNVVEARIDFGLGARIHSGQLRPVATAHITASEGFINGPLAHLCGQLQAAGILPTFGLRYPAAGRQNLLQIFTPRFEHSRLEPLRNLARLAANGTIDAVQLELSVALRWPGPLRERTLGLLTESFAASRPARVDAFPAVVARPHRAAARVKPRSPAARPAPFRFGVELFDPSGEIGVMTSIDFLGGGGARVIMLLPDGKIAICTAEGKLALHRNRLTRGPVQLTIDGGEVTVEFSGQALVVPDAAAYLRMEQAFETGVVDSAAGLKCTLRIQTATGPIRFNPHFFTAATRQTGFGTVTGTITIGGVTRALNAIGRVGVSLLGQPERAFVSRASLWGYFPDGAPGRAVEARMADEPEHRHSASGLLLIGDRVAQCRVEQLQTAPWSPGSAPATLEALLTHPQGSLRLRATPRCFMALSRPGPNASRVYTSMGFARFELDGAVGAGMFECSRALHPPAVVASLSGDD